MQRASSITCASASDKAIDNLVARKQPRAFCAIGMLLTTIPLATALIFVDPVAPSAEADPRCDRRTHTEGNLNGVWEKWRVKRTKVINRGLTIVYWEVQFSGKGPWYDGGSIGCGSAA